MESIGRHFFMFAYIISLFCGIYVLTLNKAMLTETGKIVYKKLNLFYIMLFLHIIINFSYFYKDYFISTWQWKIIILCAINSSLVIFICFGLEVLAEICHDGSRVRLPLSLASGLIYVIIYTVVRIYFVDMAETFIRPASAIAYIGSNGCFLTIGYFYCWRYGRHYGKVNTAPEFKAPLQIITRFIYTYLMMNFFVDSYFGIAKVKAMFWNINLYHLSILIYLSFNILLIWHYYTKDLFMADKTKKKNISIDSGNLQLTFDEMAKQYNLTLREKELLQYVYQGKSSPEIAALLNISANTVKRHLSNIYTKIGINSRIELIHLIRKD
jgi:DNA-binding CsgD family transcriptional regulator